MQVISDGKISLFEIQTVKKSLARGQRACLIEDFCTELDKDVGQKYKDKKGKIVTIKKSVPSTIAFFLSHLVLGDMYYFYSDCKKATCGFRRAFFYGIRSVEKSLDSKVAKSI